MIPTCGKTLNACNFTTCGNSILSIFHSVMKTLLRERIFNTQYTQLRGSL